MKTKIYFLLGLLLFSVSAFAQSYEVNGTVTDSNNQPLPGVSVVVKGTTNGTSTDFDGKYTLQVNNGDVLVFTFVGFEAQEITMSGAATVNVTMKSGVELDEVVVVGSRNPNRTATDTAVPVDVIDVTELVTAGPQVNLNQILNYVAPSFTSNTQTISDGTDHIDPASLRGLGPDQVLVLINGKRRHNSSLVNVNGTFGRGSVGTDLNAIPAASIARIEVLRDGAAAQYGSDAIAGVINIVLKESTDELSINVTTGANFTEEANDQTGGVDGETVNVSANYGLPLGNKGGFINFTGDFDFREDYSRAGNYENSVYNYYNSIERVANEAGFDLFALQTDLNRIQDFAASAGLPQDILNQVNAANSISDLQGFLGGNNTTAELAARNQTISDFNMRVGQSEVRGGRFFANFSLPLDENDTELYAFAGLGSRKGNSAGFYREPDQSRAFTGVHINGFLPNINSSINDKSIAIGIRGKINDKWNVDFSNTWGKNQFLYTISNTLNATLLNSSPTTIDAGGYSFAQNTTNLDVSRFYDDVLSGLNIAFGTEYRAENYEIIAGSEASWASYDINGIAFESLSDIPEANRVTDFFGNFRPGGAQVFPGFRPNNAGIKTRSSVAGYFDAELDVSEKFLISAATRFESYSDFGETINFKLATRVKASENFNIRAAFNTGFRAPSLHQLNFNSTSTVFDNNGDPQEVVTLPNDSNAAAKLGIPALKEETSQSVSVGFTAKIPNANLTFTVDGYWVGIDDRVVYTGQFSAPTGTFVGDVIADNGATRAAFFANAIDTESRGIDFVVTHKANFGNNVSLNSDLSATFSKTQKVGDVKASQELIDAGLIDTYFPEESRVYLEEAVPRTKINLSNSLSTGKFNVFLRNVFFGEVTEATSTVVRQQVFGSKVVTDLSFGYVASESLTLTIGANNLLDVYPDRAELEFSDGGTNRSAGRFDWSRRAQQFGIGGRFLFARLSFNLK